MYISIKKFYLNTPLKRFEYLRLKLDNFLEDVNEQYKLKEKATHNGYVYIEEIKVMYGLPQAGILLQQFLEQ